MEKGGAVTSGSSSQYALKTRAAGQTLSVPSLCFVKKATTGYAGGHKEFHLWMEKENLR